jgi:hypothetical protein
MPIKVKLPPTRDPWIMPPPEFDHEYGGDIVVKRTDEAGIKVQCRAPTNTGCAFRKRECWSTKCDGDETCLVWIVYDDILNYQRMSYDVVFRHERAHCNGWHHSPTYPLTTTNTPPLTTTNPLATSK